MVNVFPTLLSYGLFAPFILRLTIAVVFFMLGWALITTKRISTSAYFEAERYPLAQAIPWLFGISTILTGLFFLFGFFTQVASLISMYLLLNLMFIERREERILDYPQGFYVLMMIIATSLLFSGAGAWGVDLSI
jgi:uncharacterized membrane protein YphA (DoxX/SURF4 family)